jgi:hypothetical protein
LKVCHVSTLNQFNSEDDYHNGNSHITSPHPILNPGRLHVKDVNFTESPSARQFVGGSFGAGRSYGSLGGGSFIVGIPSQGERSRRANKFMSVRACFVSVHCALVLLRHGQYNEERSRRK